jgi:hypothetical protein
MALQFGQGTWIVSWEHRVGRWLSNSDKEHGLFLGSIGPAVGPPIRPKEHGLFLRRVPAFNGRKPGASRQKPALPMATLCGAFGVSAAYSPESLVAVPLAISLVVEKL